MSVNKIYSVLKLTCLLSLFNIFKSDAKTKHSRWTFSDTLQTVWIFNAKISVYCMIGCLLLNNISHCTSLAVLTPVECCFSKSNVWKAHQHPNSQYTTSLISHINNSHIRLPSAGVFDSVYINMLLFYRETRFFSPPRNHFIFCYVCSSLNPHRSSVACSSALDTFTFFLTLVCLANVYNVSMSLLVYIWMPVFQYLK